MSQERWSVCRTMSRDFRVIFDENLTFDSHVSTICENCFCHIQALRHIRPLMSAETAKMVACAIARSRLDYCNSVLARLSDANFNKLEQVQYSLARAVIGMPTYSCNHMTAVLTKLHWLPTEAQESFKIAVLVQDPPDKAAILPGGTDQGRRSIQDATSRTSTWRPPQWNGQQLSVTGARAFRDTAAKTWNSAGQCYSSWYTRDIPIPFKDFLQTFILLVFSLFPTP